MPLLPLSLMAVMTLVALTGCGSTRHLPAGEGGVVEQSCPAELQDQVVVSAAAVPRSIPVELATDAGFVKTYGGVVGRRIMISVAPKDAAHGVRILSSTLAITTIGGTFEGWAKLGAEGRAIDVIPGRLRITPFLGAPTLRAQTVMLDVLIVPGGVPVDELVVDEVPLWAASDRGPVPADALRLTLTPGRHFTAFDAVEGKVGLEFVAAKSRSAHERWRCSFDTDITLVERDAERPPLWDLRILARGGKKKSWLALFEPKTGSIRAVFASPAAASGFALWLRQTGAVRAGQYQLGLVQPPDGERLRGPSPSSPSPSPVEGTTADGFRPASAEEVAALTVGRLGEP